VKFAQAVFFLEKAAKYLSESKGMQESLPFICGGDFNSLPVSSVLSVFYGEDFGDDSKQPSAWSLPESIPQARLDLYKQIDQMRMRKAKNDMFSPLAGHLRSAYDKF